MTSSSARSSTVDDVVRRSATRHPDRIEAVTAVVVLRDGASVDEAALIAHARTSLAPYKAPKRVHFVDELPRNQSGKLLKRVLRDELVVD